MEYLANLPVSDKNNFKNVECNFSKGFPLKQVYPKDSNQKYTFIKHDNEDPVMRQLVKQREKLDNPKNKGKKTIVDFLHRKRDFSEVSSSSSNNIPVPQKDLSLPSTSHHKINSKGTKKPINKDNVTQKRKRTKK
ncbi:hypothetical protein H8356DRAFT_1418304 [Neocallimastix lanati (nom. inval.)]|nr:hypothetical protein H8356DRAFT_1418304 [Neocallimastix sp. JGI-2020a]